MEARALYRHDYLIDSEHVDFQGRLKVSSLFMYFQEISGLHAKNLGMGRDVLLGQYGLVWVLARIRVDMGKYPRWKDTISIDTWPQEPGRLGFDRDFLVKDKGGEVLARAISTWVLVDLESRKSKRPDLVYPGYPPTKKERAINTRLGGLRPGGDLETAYEKMVGYSDIDINEHLNNSKYVDIILDSFDLKTHKNYRLESIEVNYSKEALQGDRVLISKSKTRPGEGPIYIEGVNKLNNSLIFKSQVKFKEKSNNK